MLKNIPGTNMMNENGIDAFKIFTPMIQATGGLSLSQVCSITDLQASTIQNWVKRDFIPKPVHKKYFERHLARILLISSLRDCMNIDEIGALMKLINGDTEDEKDDIISESKLYDYFCRVINQMDEEIFDERNIKKCIQLSLQETSKNKDKISCALEVMVYAYQSGKCQKAALNKFEILKKL